MENSKSMQGPLLMCANPFCACSPTHVLRPASVDVIPTYCRTVHFLLTARQSSRWSRLTQIGWRSAGHLLNILCTISTSLHRALDNAVCIWDLEVALPMRSAGHPMFIHDVYCPFCLLLAESVMVSFLGDCRSHPCVVLFHAVLCKLCTS